MVSVIGNKLFRSVFCTGTGGAAHLAASSKIEPSILSSWNLVRHASKKASGGKRNPSQAPGNYRGIKKGDGTYVFPGDVLMYRQNGLWFHPGLNVALVRRRLNLVALKEGIVRITCEVPDLNYKNTAVQKWYPGREGQTFFKKYFHVIPRPQHTRFKCIDQI